MADRDFCAADGRWFYTAYELIDALVIQRLSGTEWSLFWFIVRYAYGNNKEAWADLNWSFIKKETGLADGTIQKARNKLQERKILTTIPLDSKTKVRYRINSKPSTWKPLSGRKVLSHRKVTTIPQESTPYKKTYKDNSLYSAACEVVDKLNLLSGKDFRHSEASTVPIMARMAEGFTLEDCLKVVQNKWDDKDHQNKYYRPQTLFRKKLFEGYLNENGYKPKTRIPSKAAATVAAMARRHHERE